MELGAKSSGMFGATSLTRFAALAKSLEKLGQPV
jgi:hypothetical protein